MIQCKQRDDPADTVHATLLQLYGQANRVLLGDSRKKHVEKSFSGLVIKTFDL